METNEKIIITNSFGTVTSQRIIINYKQGTEEMPVKQVYSISFRRKHNIMPAIIYFILSIGLLIGVYFVESAPEFFNITPKLIIVTAIIIAGILFLVSMLEYLGHHIIRINEVGDDRKEIKAKLSKTKEGREFVEAIEQNLLGQ